MSSFMQIAAGLGVLLSATVFAYKDGPPLRHTGGFGEPTCHACHFEGPLNGPDATSGLLLPASFEPDSTYLITVVVRRSNLGAGGFSMSTRFGDGRQAGYLRSLDKRVAIATDTDGVQFAMHTYEGTDPLASDSTSWTLSWTAPSEPDTILFHLATNAANGDDSELGDLISTYSTRSTPSGK